MSRFVAIAAAVALVVSGVVIGALSTFLVLQRPGLHNALRPPRPQPQPPPQPAPRRTGGRRPVRTEKH